MWGPVFTANNGERDRESQKKYGGIKAVVRGKRDGDRGERTTRKTCVGKETGNDHQTSSKKTTIGEK